MFSRQAERFGSPARCQKRCRVSLFGHRSGGDTAERIAIGDGVLGRDDRFPTDFRDFYFASPDLLVTGHNAKPDPGAEFAPEVEKTPEASFCSILSEGFLRIANHSGEE
jgi:hypothetical protein